jgi:hypothetical protein
VWRRGLPKKPWISITAFPALRERGPALFPYPVVPCCDLPPLPAQLASLPNTIQSSVKNGVQQALLAGGTKPQITSAAPNEAAPFNSQPLNQTTTLIVGGSLTGTELSALAIEAAVVGPATLAQVTSGAVYDIAQVNPVDNDTVPQQLVTFLFLQASDYERLHLSGVDVLVSSMDAINALAFTIQVNGQTILDRVSFLALKTLSIDSPPKAVITFQVANRDPNSAFLVYFTPKGWNYVSQGQGNYLSAACLTPDGEWNPPLDECESCITTPQGGSV